MTWGLSLLHLALASSICVGFLYIEIPGKHPDTTASRAGRRNISSRACVLSHFSCIQLCATRWTVCSPPGFSVHGISQARILEWVSVSFSRGSFQPRDQTFVTKSLFLYWGSLPKKAFFSKQYKEIEENDRMWKTRNLFKKIRNTTGTFHAKMGSIKHRNGMDLNISRRY